MIRHFFNILINKLLIVNINNNIKFTMNNNYKHYFKKTILGSKILDLLSVFKAEEDYGYIIGMSIQYNCLEEALILISMLQASNNSLLEWIINKNKKIKI